MQQRWKAQDAAARIWCQSNRDEENEMDKRKQVIFSDGSGGGYSLREHITREGTIEIPWDDSKDIPHLQLRVAWAYGAVIEARFKGDGGSKWAPCANPEFHARTEYRIKPSNPNADEIESIREEMLKLEKRLGELS